MVTNNLSGIQITGFQKRALKHMAVDKDTTIKLLVWEAIESYFGVKPYPDVEDVVRQVEAAQKRVKLNE